MDAIVKELNKHENKQYLREITAIVYHRDKNKLDVKDKRCTHEASIMTALKESNKPGSLDHRDWRDIKRKPSVIVFEGLPEHIDVLMLSLLSTPEESVVRPRAHNDPKIVIAHIFNAGEQVVGMLHEKVVGPEQSKRRMTTEYQAPTPLHKKNCLLRLMIASSLCGKGKIFLELWSV